MTRRPSPIPKSLVRFDAHIDSILGLESTSASISLVCSAPRRRRHDLVSASAGDADDAVRKLLNAYSP